MSADAPRRLGRGLEALISTAKQQREPPTITTESAPRDGTDYRQVCVADVNKCLIRLAPFLRLAALPHHATDCSARRADSRPEPGPETFTSRVFTPCSAAFLPASSAAIWAA